MLLLVKSFLRCCTEFRFKISLFFLWNQEPICELQEAFGNVKIVTSFEWNPLQAPSSAASPCELVSWASRERGFVIQIFFKSLTGNFLLRAIPYSATCHHLRRATNAWRYWSSSRSSPFITSSWTRRLYRRPVGEGAGIIILIDSRPTSFRHLPWTNHLAPIFLRLKI